MSLASGRGFAARGHVWAPHALRYGTILETLRSPRYRARPPQGDNRAVMGWGPCKIRLLLSSLRKCHISGARPHGGPRPRKIRLRVNLRRKCHISGARPPEARGHAQETHESCNCAECHTFAPFMHARGALALARAPPFDRVLWTRRDALTPRMSERLRVAS